MRFPCHGLLHMEIVKEDVSENAQKQQVATYVSSFGPWAGGQQSWPDLMGHGQ